MSDLRAGNRAATAIDYDGGLVLVHEQHNALFIYGGDARVVWDAVAMGIPLAQIRAQARLGGASAAVDILLEQWQRDGLLEAAHEPRMSAPSPIEPRPLTRRITWRARVGPCRVEFATSDPDVAHQLTAILGQSPAEDCHPDTTFVVDRVADGAFVVFHDGRELLRTLDEGLMRGAIYQASLDVLHGFPDWQALIHGAALGRGGRAIGLPAPSGSGKTTLTAWLASRGFDYIADDLLAILPGGQVAPWPLPISVKPGSVDILSAAYPELATSPTIEASGKSVRLIPAPPSSWTRAPLPLTMLVFPRFDPLGDGETRRLRPLECLARLVSDRVWIGYPLTGKRVGQFLGWLETIPAFSIDYPDLKSAELAIDALCKP